MSITKNEYEILKAIKENNCHVLRSDLISNFPDIASSGTYRYLLDSNLLCEHDQLINNRATPVCDLTPEGSHSILEYEATDARITKAENDSSEANKIAKQSMKSNNMFSAIAIFVSLLALFISFLQLLK